MTISSLLGRFFGNPICFGTITLIVIISVTPAVCGEIHDAVKAGDVTKVKALLKEDPDLVFGKDDRGCTLLHIAAMYGHKDVAALLIANKAEVNAKASKGMTPLFLAAAQSYKEVVILLLANGAEVNAKATDFGWTPLHYAAQWGHVEMAALLLANRADVNSKDNKGATPLLIAIQQGYKDIAELLMRTSAEKSLELNPNGGTIISPGMGTTGVGSGRGPYVFGNGVTNPIPLAHPKPLYTEEARKANISGSVEIDCIVRKDGTVDSFKILRGLGYGLDESAVQTITKKWRFKPGEKNGVPVDVHTRMVIQFQPY